MRATFSTLAEHAFLSQEGKLSIIEMFDRLRVVSVPVIIPRCVLVTLFAIEAVERGRIKQTETILLNEDGQEILKATSPLMIPPNFIDDSVINQIGTLINLTLPQFGRYAFHTLVDGDTKARTAFIVEKQG